MIRPLLALAAVALVLATGPAASQPAAEPVPAGADDGQIPDLVSAFVVQAVTPGPAWWKVTRGDSVVWILGTPPYVSAKLNWDKRPFQRRLTGARLFLTPLYLTLQPFKIDSRGRRQDDNTDYWRKPGETVADLPPATQARLAAAYKALADRAIDDHWSIIFATRQLNQALFDKVPLSLNALSAQLTQAAALIRVSTVKTQVDTTGASSDYAEGPVGPKIACLEATLTVAETGPNPLRKGLEAWAVGDLSSAMATAGCVGAKGREYQQEAVSVTAMLRSYLNVPGKSVAAVELIPLLMKNGVIDRLTAAGYKIDGPDSQDVAKDYEKEMGGG